MIMSKFRLILWELYSSYLKDEEGHGICLIKGVSDPLMYLSNRFTILAVSVQSETIIFTLNIGCPQQEV